MASAISSSYNQEEKEKCRRKAIKHAIESLTTGRPKSLCVQQSDVGKFWEYLKTNVLINLSQQDIEDVTMEVEQWKRFHESQIQTRTPSDLRVCYLGGDNPVNDLKVFVEHGVLCQNVWAIEKDKKTLEKAWKSIKDSNLRNVRMFKGDIRHFLKEFEGQFDIIYYDACGPLPSWKQNTLQVIGYVFLYNKLTSPGALITNFSFPPKSEENVVAQASDEEEDVNKLPSDEQREQINFLAQEYLKNRLVNTLLTFEEYESIDEFLESNADEDNYSDYITYQVIDTAYLLVPAFRMLSSTDESLWDQIFVKKKRFLDELKSYESYANLGRSTEAKCKRHCKQAAKKSLYRRIGSAFSVSYANDFCNAWNDQIFPDWKSGSITKKYNISSLLSTPLIWSNNIFIHRFSNKACKERCFGPFLDFLHDKSEKKTVYYKACLLITGLLCGQLACPSFPVLNKLMHLRYTARKRQMFCDVFIFDKCRYVYEQFPSVDCAFFAMEEKKQQMVICMAVACLRNHLENICKDFFHNCDFASIYPEMDKAIFPNVPQYSFGKREMIVKSN